VNDKPISLCTFQLGHYRKSCSQRYVDPKGAYIVLIMNVLVLSHHPSRMQKSDFSELQMKRLIPTVISISSSFSSVIILTSVCDWKIMHSQRTMPKEY
jgi:hypothetical protein